MRIYELMDWLDSRQPQIEHLGNVSIVIMIVAIVLLWTWKPRKRLTNGWCKASKLMFWEEIRKHG